MNYFTTSYPGLLPDPPSQRETHFLDHGRIPQYAPAATHDHARHDTPA